MHQERGAYPPLSSSVFMSVLFLVFKLKGLPSLEHPLRIGCEGLPIFRARRGAMFGEFRGIRRCRSNGNRE